MAAIAPYVFGSVYNASKAALHSWSHTLGLELEPFGVRVMVVITGGVKSRIARTERVLPENSLYLEVGKEFERRVLHSQEGAMPNEGKFVFGSDIFLLWERCLMLSILLVKVGANHDIVYAKGVVAAALKKNPTKWLWRGHKTLLVRFVSGWAGSWLFDFALPRMFGLARLKALLKAKMKAKQN